MRQFPRFWRKLSVISLLLAIFRRLNATSIAFYTPNVTHAVSSVETIPTVSKLRQFTQFWRKLSVISILLEIFGRLNATSIAFYTSNAMHAVFGVERSRPVRKMRSFTRFWRKLSAISLLLEIFRRLNAISIAFYTANTMHDSFIVDRSRPCEKCDNLLDFEENCALFRSCWKYFED